MKKNKFERVEGTSRYVKMNNRIYDTVPKDTTPKHTICECLYCGSRFGVASGKCPIYCKSCRTQEQRDAIAKENEELLKNKK